MLIDKRLTVDLRWDKFNEFEHINFCIIYKVLVKMSSIGVMNSVSGSASAEKSYALATYISLSQLSYLGLTSYQPLWGYLMSKISWFYGI